MRQVLAQKQIYKQSYTEKGTFFLSILHINVMSNMDKGHRFSFVGALSFPLVNTIFTRNSNRNLLHKTLPLPPIHSFYPSIFFHCHILLSNNFYDNVSFLLVLIDRYQLSFKLFLTLKYRIRKE